MQNISLLKYNIIGFVLQLENSLSWSQYLVIFRFDILLNLWIEDNCSSWTKSLKLTYASSIGLGHASLSQWFILVPCVPHGMLEFHYIGGSNLSNTVVASHLAIQSGCFWNGVKLLVLIWDWKEPNNGKAGSASALFLNWEVSVVVLLDTSKEMGGWN